ncbi:MAG: META domain-containing protein [Betaproteobacteria bacterium]
MSRFGGKLKTCAGVAAAILVVGCTVPRPHEPPREPAAPTVLKIPVSREDGAWEMTDSSFIGAGRIPGVPRATLTFEEGRISAYSGCNRASGVAQHAEGRLEISALTATRRACAEPLNTFETRYFNLLRAQPVYRLDGDTLMLIDDRHSARFRRVSGATGAKP